MCDIPFTPALCCAILSYFWLQLNSRLLWWRDSRAPSQFNTFLDSQNQPRVCLCVRLHRATVLLCITSALVDLPCGFRQTLTHTHTNAHTHHTHLLSPSRPHDHKYRSSGTNGSISPTEMSLCQMQSQSSALPVQNILSRYSFLYTLKRQTSWIELKSCDTLLNRSGKSHSNLIWLV